MGILRLNETLIHELKNVEKHECHSHKTCLGHNIFLSSKWLSTVYFLKPSQSPLEFKKKNVLLICPLYCCSHLSPLSDSSFFFLCPFFIFPLAVYLLIRFSNCSLCLFVSPPWLMFNSARVRYIYIHQLYLLLCLTTVWSYPQLSKPFLHVNWIFLGEFFLSWSNVRVFEMAVELSQLRDHFCDTASDFALTVGHW